MAQTTTLIKQPSRPHALPADPPQMVIDIVNELIQTCADGADGFASCADYSNISRHRTLFRQRAQDCDAARAQLCVMVLRMGGQPAVGGFTGAIFHRGWVAARGTLSGLCDQSILAECERGEAVAFEYYRNALTQHLPSDVRHLVQRQCDDVERNLGQMRSWREAETALV